MKLQTWVFGRVLFIIVAIAVLVLLSSVNPMPTKLDQVSLPQSSPRLHWRR